MVCKMGCYVVSLALTIQNIQNSPSCPIKYSIIHYTAFHDFHIRYDAYMQEPTIWLECYFASLLFPFNFIFCMSHVNELKSPS